MIHTGRHFLQIPGPTNVPDRVLRAMDQPVIDHRGPEFAALTAEVLEGLQGVFQTSGPVIIFPASGTGAAEAALVNTLSPGDRVLIFETGHFSSVWQGIAERLGLRVDYVPGNWRRGASAAELERRLSSDPDHTFKAVVVVHNETSTGVASRIADLRRAMDAVGHPALLIVDAVSSLASIDFRHDEWQVDVTVTGSQKGLMLPPGLSFNAISEKALAANREARLPRNYWDWEEILKWNRKGFFPYTPATNLLYALREALRMLQEEGLANVFRRHDRHAEATRAAVRGWGLELVCEDPREYSSSMTAFFTAGRPRRRPAARSDPRALRHVARHGPLQAGRQRHPHRTSGRVQRSDAGGHAMRHRDGSPARGCAPQGRRRAWPRSSRLSAPVAIG